MTQAVATPWQIIQRTSCFFIITLLWTGAINVLPQVYLLEHFPGNKNLFLSIILSLSTLGAIAGTRYSQRQLQQRSTPARRPFVLAITVCLVTYLVLLLEIRTFIIFLIAHVVFRFTSNWLFNHLDHTMLAVVDSSVTKLHATMTTGFQLLGQMLGPAAFVLLASHEQISSSLLVLCCGWMAVISVKMVGKGPHVIIEHQPSAPTLGWRALPKRARIFLLYALFGFAGMIAIFAQFIFVLGDYIAMADSVKTGGFLITSMGVFSVVTAMVSLKQERATQSEGSFVWPAFLFILSISWLLTKPSMEELVIASVLAGVGGGRFLILTRMYATFWEGPPGRTALLSLYNNIPNYASLLAFILIAGLTMVLDETAQFYVPALLVVLLFMFIVSACLGVLLDNFRN